MTLMPTFLHSPRTGGTAIADALGYGRRIEQHKPHWARKTLVRPWTIVRNPFSRAVSICAFLYRERLRTSMICLPVEWFELWLAGGRKDQYGRDPILYVDCEYAIPVHAQMVEFVGRHNIAHVCYETLQEEWSALCEYVGVGALQYPSYDEYNISAHRHWRYYYRTPKTVDMIAEMYAQDFATFGYSNSLGSTAWQNRGSDSGPSSHLIPPYNG